MKMWNSKISYTLFLSVFIKQILCEVMKEGDDQSKTKQELYKKNYINRAIIVRPLPPPFLPPLFRPLLPPPPPFLVSLGVPRISPNGLSGIQPFSVDHMFIPLPIDYYRPFQNPYDKSNPAFNLNSGLNLNFEPAQNHGGSLRNIGYNQDDGRSISLIDPFRNIQNQLSVNAIQSGRHFGPPQEQNHPINEDRQKPANIDVINQPPTIEILRSIGYSLPSEVIFNHPFNYAKDYMVDGAASNTESNIHQNVTKKNPNLLTGEEEYTNGDIRYEILTEMESVPEESLNQMETIHTSYPNQYHSTNTKAIMFESEKNKNKPKNIYEVIYAQKSKSNTSEEAAKRLKDNANIYSKEGEDESHTAKTLPEDPISINPIYVQDNEENDDRNVIADACKNENCVIAEEEEELTVLGLEKTDDDNNNRLLLLFPQDNDGAIKKSPKKRSTNESFNVNIGAGYGVGIDQNAPLLPESTTQLNSTHIVVGSLQNDAIVIGHPPEIIPNFDAYPVETRSASFREKPSIETKKGIMDMKELQQIIHNVDDDSEYSKIVQVVKVPAVYEIHLEKVQQHKKHVSKDPTKYIHQINNLISRPKKKIVTNRSPTNNIVYGSAKARDYVKIDDWQAERHKKDRQTNQKQIKINANPYVNVHQESHSIRPVLKPPTVHAKIRDKKNTQYRQNRHPAYTPPASAYIDYYSPQSANFGDSIHQYPTLPKQPIYSTLTRILPYNLRRNYQYNSQRSEILPNDLVYGAQKEKVLNPDEINITMQPGTTIVSLPKLQSQNERQFAVSNIANKNCQKEFHQSELMQAEETAEGSNIDDIYFTTITPREQNFRSSRRSPKFIERRSDPVPIKYILYVNKIHHDDW